MVAVIVALQISIDNYINRHQESYMAGKKLPFIREILSCVTRISVKILADKTDPSLWFSKTRNERTTAKGSFIQNMFKLDIQSDLIHNRNMS